MPNCTSHHPQRRRASQWLDRPTRLPHVAGLSGALGLRRGHDLDQHGHALFLRDAARADERGADLLRVLDALGAATQRTRQIRVVAAQVTRPESLLGFQHARGLDSHGVVVGDDGNDGDSAAHGGLEVQPSHAERGVAHPVDANLVGRSELGAHGKAQARAQRVGLAPADV